MQHIGKILTFVFTVLISIVNVIMWINCSNNFSQKALGTSIIISVINIGFLFLVVKDILTLARTKSAT